MTTVSTGTIVTIVGFAVATGVLYAISHLYKERVAKWYQENSPKRVGEKIDELTESTNSLKSTVQETNDEVEELSLKIEELGYELEQTKEMVVVIGAENSRVDEEKLRNALDIDELPGDIVVKPKDKD